MGADRHRWRPAWLEIDLDAIVANVAALRTHVGPEVKLYFVVKAMGYGHGAVEAGRAGLEAGVDGLCVVSVDEARQLRDAGLRCPILLTGGSLPYEARDIVALGVKVVVYEERMARELSVEAARSGREVDLHLKVDTGMGRFGVPWSSAAEVALTLKQLPATRLEGIMTHFAVSDALDKSFARLQTHRLRQVLQECESKDVRFSLIHTANTGAILDLPETHFNMVRPGISIYGVYPSPHVNRQVTLMPAMALKARIVSLKRLPRGHSVSYGRRYFCMKSEWVGVLPVGYHDGYPRHMGNRGRVLLPDGSSTPVVGGVAMDATMIRIEDPSAAPLGEEVILMGRAHGQVIDVHELAEAAGTVSYDVLSGFSPRLPRVYLRGGKPWRVLTMLGCYSVDSGQGRE
jgi:alanine racemase